MDWFYELYHKHKSKRPEFTVHKYWHEEGQSMESFRVSDMRISGYSDSIKSMLRKAADDGGNRMWKWLSSNCTEHSLHPNLHRSQCQTRFNCPMCQQMVQQQMVQQSFEE